MIIFPGTKINLGLYVHPRRADGFHNLETGFYPTAFSDVLELLPAEKDELVTTGLSISGPAEDNLCWKALQLLRPEGLKGRWRIHLHKIVPTGAGLGGGSADGAAVLKGLNQLGSLHLPEEKLADLALQLGSDCPFFIYQKPLLATGRGEQFSPLSFSLKDYHLLLVLPGIHVSTKAAFGSLVYQPVPEGWQAILQAPPDRWKELGLRNDFEQGVFGQHPVLGEIKQQLLDAGAAFAAMSGSGSTVFGIFPKMQKPQLTFAEGVTSHWSACPY